MAITLNDSSCSIKRFIGGLTDQQKLDFENILRRVPSSKDILSILQALDHFGTRHLVKDIPDNEVKLFKIVSWKYGRILRSRSSENEVRRDPSTKVISHRVFTVSEELDFRRDLEQAKNDRTIEKYAMAEVCIHMTDIFNMEGLSIKDLKRLLDSIK